MTIQSKQNISEIDQFYEYFLNEIAKITALTAPPLYKKILYVSILDTLAQARYGDTKQRFIKFIRNHSSWEDADRVGVVQLSYNLNFVLRNNTDKEKGKFLDFVNQQISLFEEGKVYRSEKDPFFNDISFLAQSLTEKKALKFARYPELLYSYRNLMVHNFRKPGYGIEMSSDGTTPYYHSYMDKGWEMVYPVGLFEFLCRNGLDGLKKYLINKDIDPYEQYKFGSMWTQKDKLIESKSLFNRLKSFLLKY